MQKELDKEIQRKAFHLGFGMIFAALIYFELASWITFLIILVIGSGLMIYIKHSKKNVPGISELIDKIGRKNEFPGLGTITFVFGTLISVILFPKDIAAASIMILAVGDSASSIIGANFGKTKILVSSTINVSPTVLNDLAIKY